MCTLLNKKKKSTNIQNKWEKKDEKQKPRQIRIEKIGWHRKNREKKEKKKKKEMCGGERGKKKDKQMENVVHTAQPKDILVSLKCVLFTL